MGFATKPIKLTELLRSLFHEISGGLGYDAAPLLVMELEHFKLKFLWVVLEGNLNLGMKLGFWGKVVRFLKRVDESETACSNAISAVAVSLDDKGELAVNFHFYFRIKLGFGLFIFYIGT